MTMHSSMGLYIDGRWRDGEGRVTIPVLNPANEEVLANCRGRARPDGGGCSPLRADEASHAQWQPFHDCVPCYLAGYQYVSDAIANPVLRKLIHDFMTDEAMPSLPGTLDRIAYREALLARFGNPSLRRRTWQIAMDGSQKLPQRLLGTIRDRLAAGGGFTRAALGVAAWMRYASGTDDNGRPIDVQDPLADRFRDTATGARGSWRSLMDGFLEIREVFDEGLARNDAFRSVLSAQLRTLSTQGSIAAISSVSSASD